MPSWNEPLASSAVAQAVCCRRPLPDASLEHEDSVLTEPGPLLLLLSTLNLLPK